MCPPCLQELPSLTLKGLKGLTTMNCRDEAELLEVRMLMEIGRQWSITIFRYTLLDGNLAQREQYPIR